MFVEHVTEGRQLEMHRFLPIAVIFSEGQLYGYWGYDLELTLIHNYS